MTTKTFGCHNQISIWVNQISYCCTTKIGARDNQIIRLAKCKYLVGPTKYITVRQPNCFDHANQIILVAKFGQPNQMFSRHLD